MSASLQLLVVASDSIAPLHSLFIVALTWVSHQARFSRSQVGRQLSRRKVRTPQFQRAIDVSVPLPSTREALRFDNFKRPQYCARPRRPYVLKACSDANCLTDTAYTSYHKNKEREVAFSFTIRTVARAVFVLPSAALLAKTASGHLVPRAQRGGKRVGISIHAPASG